MSTLLSLLHFACGFVVLAEALNKLERTDIFDGRGGALSRLAGLRWLAMPWRWRKRQVVVAFKLLAWSLLSIGAAGAIVTPLVHLEPPSFQDVAVIAGFALLIVRSRLKEG